MSKYASTREQMGSNFRANHVFHMCISISVFVFCFSNIWLCHVLSENMIPQNLKIPWPIRFNGFVHTKIPISVGKTSISTGYYPITSVVGTALLTTNTRMMYVHHYHSMIIVVEPYIVIH